MEKQEGAFNPQEHTRWAKQRALEILKQGDLMQAIDSMVSDLRKDPTRPPEQVRMLTMMGMITRNDPALDEKKVREFIEGFAE
ncbi:MAG: hypothetical protein ABH846_01365 [Patescibacteria group bacterium]